MSNLKKEKDQRILDKLYNSSADSRKTRNIINKFLSNRKYTFGLLAFVFVSFICAVSIMVSGTTSLNSFPKSTTVASSVTSENVPPSPTALRQSTNVPNPTSTGTPTERLDEQTPTAEQELSKEEVLAQLKETFIYHGIPAFVVDEILSLFETTRVGEDGQPTLKTETREVGKNQIVISDAEGNPLLWSDQQALSYTVAASMLEQKVEVENVRERAHLKEFIRTDPHYFAYLPAVPFEVQKEFYRLAHEGSQEEFDAYLEEKMSMLIGAYDKLVDDLRKDGYAVVGCNGLRGLELKKFAANGEVVDFEGEPLYFVPAMDAGESLSGVEDELGQTVTGTDAYAIADVRKGPMETIGVARSKDHDLTVTFQHSAELIFASEDAESSAQINPSPASIEATEDWELWQEMFIEVLLEQMPELEGSDIVVSISPTPMGTMKSEFPLPWEQIREVSPSIASISSNRYMVAASRKFSDESNKKNQVYIKTLVVQFVSGDTNKYYPLEVLYSTFFGLKIIKASDGDGPAVGLSPYRDMVEYFFEEGYLKYTDRDGGRLDPMRIIRE